jgi:hypothetical protein
MDEGSLAVLRGCGRAATLCACLGSAWHLIVTPLPTFCLQVHSNQLGWSVEYGRGFALMSVFLFTCPSSQWVITLC